MADAYQLKKEKKYFNLEILEIQIYVWGERYE
jgi:hypothetical protein